MYLLNDYCHSDLASAADSLNSDIQFLFDNQLAMVTATGSQLNFIDQFAATTATITLPSCSFTGYQNTYTGVTFEDATLLSWLSVTVLVTAYFGLQIKRAINLS